MKDIEIKTIIEYVSKIYKWRNKIIMEENMYSPKEIVQKYMKGSEAKVALPVYRTIILGLLAGGAISLGAVGSSVSMYGISSTGVSRTLGATVFPIGLMLIIILGGELFTGNCLLIMGAIDKRYNPLLIVKNLVIVWLSNFAGALIIAFLASSCGEFGFSDSALGAYVIKTAMGKINLSFSTAFFSGILCNILVCAAVLMALGAKDMVGKIFAIFFPIFVFVICGFEHCVANMYYISAGILSKLNTSYCQKAIEMYGYTSEQIGSLNFTNMIISNLIPVTLGNIVGGMIFLGLPLVILNKDK